MSCSFFTMVGSKVIRPDTVYHLSVTSQGFDTPSVLAVSINGTEEGGRIYLKSQEVTLDRDETKMLTFDVGVFSNIRKNCSKKVIINNCIISYLLMKLFFMIRVKQKLFV